MSTETKSQLIDNIVAYLQANGGRASAVEVCSEIMGISNCSREAAKQIVVGGLMQDSRIRVLGSGDVVLRSKKLSDPDVESLCYAVIDIETTGLPSPRHRITEIAVVFVEHGKVIDRFSTLVNPGIPIPPRITQMTGITNEMVADAPPFEDVAGLLLEMLEGKVLVAHNSPFDMNFINAELNRTHGVGLANEVLCTVRLARKLVPGLDSHRLDSIAHYFNIPIESRHRALGDALATALAFNRLCCLAEEMGWTKLSQLKRVAGTRNSRRLKRTKSDAAALARQPKK